MLKGKLGKKMEEVNYHYFSWRYCNGFNFVWLLENEVGITAKIFFGIFKTLQVGLLIKPLYYPSRKDLDFVPTKVELNYDKSELWQIRLDLAIASSGKNSAQILKAVGNHTQAFDQHKLPV